MSILSVFFLCWWATLFQRCLSTHSLNGWSIAVFFQTLNSTVGIPFNSDFVFFFQAGKTCYWEYSNRECGWRTQFNSLSVLSAYKAHRVKVVVVSCHSCNGNLMQGFITSFPVHIMFIVNFFRRRYWKSKKTTGFFSREYSISSLNLSHTHTHMQNNSTNFTWFLQLIRRPRWNLQTLSHVWKSVE